MTQKEDIKADVDDAIYDLQKTIQKKYKLTSKEARDLTNYNLRVLMLSNPEKWL